MPNPVTPPEREQIVTLLREHGGNRNKVAKLCGRSPGTVQTIANREGIPPTYSAPKKANEARREYAEAERLALSDELFEQLRKMARHTMDAGDFRDLVVSYGVLTDKRRLETGEATNRTENVDPAARNRVRQGLDELARRRRDAMAGGS